MTERETLLDVEGVVHDYVLPRRSLWRRAERFRALHQVSFAVVAGRSFGIVGESGCGKSTLARVVTALEPPVSGSVTIRGQNIFTLSSATLRAHRRHFQIVFQDPFGSLDPRQRIGRIVSEPLGLLGLKWGRAESRERVAEALEAVGLNPVDAEKFPHEFSGGQRQRIAIARALITRPSLIVADEAVSALDVSVQAQVLNLILDLQDSQGVTYLFISHDLSVVRHVTEEVAVMYRGRIVEQGKTARVFAQPAHPYTQALVAAVPRAGRRRRGTPRQASPQQAPTEPAKDGCPFAPRCPRAIADCHATEPTLRPIESDRLAACHLL